MRARPGVPSFRQSALFAAIGLALAAASTASFRVVQFSVQSNHVHLVVEAHDKDALARGMQGLMIRVARATNRALDVRGIVWRERYHARELKTPRAVRIALVYVLMNAKKHGHALRGADPYSSAPWFDGFVRTGAPSPIDDASPVRAPRTWLARVGWRRRGLISPTERPRADTMPP